MTDQQPHTPTTQYVRNSYIDHRYSLAAEQGEFPPGIVERMNEFDRWYAAEFGRIIAAAEQRGAIKALRDTATQMESTADTLSELWEHYMLPGDIIAWLRHRADQMEG